MSDIRAIHMPAERRDRSRDTQEIPAMSSTLTRTAQALRRDIRAARVLAIIVALCGLLATIGSYAVLDRRLEAMRLEMYRRTQDRITSGEVLQLLRLRGD